MDQSPTAEQVARAYVTAAVDPDPERYLALFADDVVVHDDGRTHTGVAAVRAWRAEVPPVRYDLREVTGDPDDLVATARVSGDFPGSPIDLRHSIRRDDSGRIVALDIAP